MTPLSHYVVSLEIAKEMKELGFHQESLFYWVELISKDGIQTRLIYQDGMCKKYAETQVEYSAYTSGELGEMLPDDIVYYKEENNGMDFVAKHKTVTVWNDTEANARAKMLIHLKKSGGI